MRICRQINSLFWKKAHHIKLLVNPAGGKSNDLQCLFVTTPGNVPGFSHEVFVRPNSHSPVGELVTDFHFQPGVAAFGRKPHSSFFPKPCSICRPPPPPAFQEGRVPHLFLRPSSPVSSPQGEDMPKREFPVGGRSSGQSRRTTFQTRGERFSLSLEESSSAGYCTTANSHKIRSKITKIKTV